MNVTKFSKARRIPTKLSTAKSSPTTTNFAKGIYTYKANDLMDYDEIYLAQNARFERIGEYKTRYGLRNYLGPIGATSEGSIYGDYEMIDITPDTKIVLSSETEKILSGITVRYIINKTAADKDIIRAIAYYENATEPEAIACVNAVGTLSFNFKNGIRYGGLSSNLVIKFIPQNNPNHKYQISVEPGTTNIKHSLAILPSDAFGRVISMFEANITGNNGTISPYILFAFKDITGTVKLYRTDSVPESGTSVNTYLIRTLPSGVEKVRFSQDGNIIRYADGKEGPHKIDPSNNWTDSAIPTIDLKTGVDLNIKVSNILTGTQDNIIYFDADTNTQAVWTYPYGFQYAEKADYTTTATLQEYVPGTTTSYSVAKNTLKATSETHLVSAITTGDLILDESGNYAQVSSVSSSSVTVTSVSHTALPINSYDKFDRDFRQNFPAIKTGDPLTAMFNLGGVIYFLTRRNKYYMYSQTADVWTQQASSAQHGTFSQESCVCDLNYAYYACDDGIYVFDGASEVSLTQNSIQSTYDEIKFKERIRLQLFNNRLYVFYETENRYGYNNVQGKNCLVYNINLKLWESIDTGLPIEATIGRHSASNRFLCGSNSKLELVEYEKPHTTEALSYHDLESPIDFDLETSYVHFGTPSQLHRITKWRPEFALEKSADIPDYAVKCGYALDFTNDVKYVFSIGLKDHSILNEHYVWDNPPNYGNNIGPTKLSTIPQVNGQFYRCQIRYQLHGAFTPVKFKAHTLSCETQRLR